MKKLISVFVLLCISILAHAQVITFLSVPLRGDITTFIEKLEAKGIKVNKTISSKLEDGMRAFDVPAFQYPCQACVFYNTSTRDVFEGVLMFTTTTTLTEFSRFMDHFAQQIGDKYNKGIYTMELEDGEYNSLPTKEFTIYSSKDNKKIGEIYLYMGIKQYDKKSGTGTFMFHVMYRNSEAPDFDTQMKDYY